MSFPNNSSNLRRKLCPLTNTKTNILPKDLPLLQVLTRQAAVRDSKKISEKKRDMLFDIICEKAISYGIAYASVEEIDELNILNASQLAMRRAVDMLTPHPDLVIVDGNIARGFDCKAVTLIKGDAISMSVAAASILAKVSRDRVCEELDKQYPEYMLAKHKGYSTKLHMDLVRKYGPSPIHRKTFLKFLNK